MRTISELKEIKDAFTAKRQDSEEIRVIVGMGTCGISAGATPVYEALRDGVKRLGLEKVTVCPTGCIGMCTYEPIVEVKVPGKDTVTYIHVDAKKAETILKYHIQEGVPVSEYTI